MCAYECYICMYVSICMFVCGDTYMFVYTCMSMWALCDSVCLLYVGMHTYILAYICALVYMSVFVCICV